MIRPKGLTSDLLTVDEFFAIVPDGQKADLIDGVIYMASPDSLEADDLQGFIKNLMRTYITARGISGRVTGSRVAFVLDEFHAPEPDVAYLRPDRAAEQSGKRVQGPPDIAVEVAGAESRSRDYGVKKRLYAEAGVREYWIIDSETRQAEFYILAAGRFEPLALEDGNLYRSTVIPGFWLDVRWLMANPLPSDYHCQRLILGES